MKKLLLFVLVVMGFAACTNDPVEEQVAVQHDAPETITVGFEGDDTRIQLNEAQKTVWTKGDQVSVFYKSDANQKYEYRGETGARTAELHKVSAGSSTTKMGYVVVAYPYNEEYIISPASGNLETMLPSVQHYTVDSYGVGDNLMVSCSEFTQFSLKSVCGWLKLQLTGNGEVVKGIKFRGNNGEQVAGLIHVDTKSAEATLYSEEVAPDDNGNANGSLVIDGAMATEVMLYCDEGVTLSNETTAFYIALPPQTFEEGFSVDIICTDGTMMAKSSDKKLSIERNHIQPMAAFEFAASVLNNQIWYTSSDGNIVEPENPDAFGANIMSNKYDNGKGVINFDGDVTAIGDYAFTSCKSLTSITIPDSVTTIGYQALAGCDSLTSVTIGDSVTTIGWYAFTSCYSLTSVTIPDSVTRIVDYAFSDCSSLTSVTIPDSVTTIGSSAFQYCDSLTSVTIGDSVTTIGDDAFAYCSSLTSVTIPDSVTTIGGYAFCVCESLTEVYCYATVPPSLGSHAFGSNASGRRIYVYEECVEVYKSAWSDYKDSIYTNGQNCSETTTIEYTTNDGNIVTTQNMPVVSNIYGNGVGILVVVGKISKIADYAFCVCESLTSVNIPDSVTTIGNYAFYGCESLTSVTIPDSVTTIKNSAFSGCTSLTSVTIPDSVTTIGNYAFGGCDSLKEFKGKYATEDGRSLIMDNTIIAYANASGTTYTIPYSVTTIGNAAFYESTSLTSVTIPDSVTEIGASAFYACTSLTSVTIPDSVTRIVDYAFFRCTSLTSVYCKAITPPAGGYEMFYDNNASGRKIYVPAESVDAYKSKSAYYWSVYASDIVGYDFENGVVVE